MIYKVCGMREADNIREVEGLQVGDGTSGMAQGIDLMGFIFWPKSKRYVAEPPSYLPERAKKVGVFVDASLEDIRQHIEDYHLDLIQLHGHETPEFITQLSPLTSHLSIIKAFNIATAEDLKQTKPYEGIVEYFLFDTRKPPEETGGWHPPGGTGEKFDWDVLHAYHGQTPFLLSGGISPDDAERVREFHHPRCVGIDLNSRFELAPALKDVNQLKEFLKKVKR